MMMWLHFYMLQEEAISPLVHGLALIKCTIIVSMAVTVLCRQYHSVFYMQITVNYVLEPNDSLI